MTDLTFTADEQPKMSAFNERFSILNGLYQYWWKRRFSNDSGLYKYVETPVDTTLRIMQNAPVTISWAKSISIDQSTGEILMNDPQVVTYEEVGPLASDFNFHQGDYFGGYYNSNGAVLLIPLNTSGMTTGYSSGSTYYVDIKPGYCTKITTEFDANLVIGPWEYVSSFDRDAYPDSGESGGYEYQYLGIPFDNAREAPKIATGSYIGTGTYGASNPNTLTFEFEPKVWGVYSHVSHIDNNSYVTLYDKNIFPWGINTEEFEIATNINWTISFDGNKANWYGTNATYQRNSSGIMYYYLALG